MQRSDPYVTEDGSTQVTRKGRVGRYLDSFKPALDNDPSEKDVKKGDDGTRVYVKDADAAEKGSSNAGTRVEVTTDGDQTEDDSKLKRRLQGRHIQMIAIGGSIGTGLFIGSGSALANGGPGSVLIDFILIGFMLFNVVMALGELAVTFPVQGSFSVYSTRFIHPAWGFAMGWNYVLQWIVTLPLELTAASIVIQYWDTEQKVNPAVWITIFLVITVVINLFGVRGYGEAEFVYSTVKVLAVVGFILLGIIINCGGAPDHHYYGVQTWRDPGAFANGFKGFCSVFVTAAFAFSGTELVGLAAAETANPRRSLPHATKQVFWRITLFYILTLLLVGFLVRYDDPRLEGTSSSDARASPFVIAISNAGIKVLPSIFNAVILVSVLSVGNSAVFATSRTLTALASYRQAPQIFAYVDREGRPLVSIFIVLVFGLLAYIQLSSNATTVFNWLLALGGLSALFTWGSVSLAHIRFRQVWKARGRTVEELPFRAAFGVWGSWFGFLLCCLVLIANFYIALFPIGSSPNAYDFFLSYLAAPIVIVFFLVWWLIHWKRDHFMTLGEIDIDTGRRNFPSLEELRAERQLIAEKSFFPRIWHALC